MSTFPGFQNMSPHPSLLPSSAPAPLGHLPRLALASAPFNAEPPHRWMARAARDAPLAHLAMGTDDWLLLSTPEAVHDALVVKGADFAGRPVTPSMRLSSKQAGFARAEPSRGLAKLRRAAFGELMSSERVRASHAAIEDEVERLAEHLLARPNTELRPALRRCVANMVLRYTFSERVGYGDDASTSVEPFAELLEVVDDVWRELTSTPTLALDLLGVAEDALVRGDRLQQLVERRNQLLNELVTRRRASLSPPRGDMLDILLAAGLPEQDVLYTLVDLFVAGVNTVSTALEWMLLLTSEHPLEQSRARAAELRSSAPPPVPSSSAPPTRVEALVNEVLRAKPPLLIPRQALRDSEILGNFVSKGQIVYANHWALTHSVDHWLEPSAFRPERWLLEERAFSQARGAEACKFMPFSVGARSCPGAVLAAAELHIGTSVLLRTVRWSRTTSIDLREQYGLTLSPVTSQRLRFSRVGSAAAAASAASPRSTIPQMRTRWAGNGVGDDESTERPPQDSPERRTQRPAAARAEGRTRVTRRQRASSLQDEDLVDHVEAVGIDRRAGWRASKAKASRRNRRYQKRLLAGLQDDE